MDTIILSIRGLSPYTQSRLHATPKLESERGAGGADAYDERTWRAHLHVENGSVVIPAFALKMALVDGAKYSKETIPGAGKSTWTAKFMAGIGIFENAPLGVAPEDVDKITINAHADGRRGSGTRVLRRFPQIKKGWQADVPVTVLDATVTPGVLERMAGFAGYFVGIGQYRPQSGGTNGRFEVTGCRMV